jgi:RNA polymerase sigma factor (sigma-70 family)
LAVVPRLWLAMPERACDLTPEEGGIMRRDQGRDPGADELERLLAERGNRLMGIVIALTGRRADAEDLLQAALERLLRNRQGVTYNAEAYLRRTLYNLAADGWRRRGAWRRKIPLLRTEHASAEADAAADPIAVVDLRDALVRLLMRLPPHQRAVIGLRYWEQLSAAEAAEVLGCSEGAVKSAGSKALRRLRELAGSWPDGEAVSGGNERAAPPRHTEARRRSPPITSAHELVNLAKEGS